MRILNYIFQLPSTEAEKENFFESIKIELAGKFHSEEKLKNVIKYTKQLLTELEQFNHERTKQDRQTN